MDAIKHRTICEDTAWHGSPKDFKRFSASKVGTGQGESKHGWGIYLTSEIDRASFYATLSTSSGSVYLVEVPTGLYLDWDLPLVDQPKATSVIRAALPVNEDHNVPIGLAAQFDHFVDCGWRGLEGYKHLAKLFSNKKRASLALLAHGLTGITYLGRDEWDGLGIRTYVIFDPSKLKIASKVTV
jgi:hypothetical protein